MPPTEIIVDTLCWLPLAWLTEKDVAFIRRKLTIHPLTFDRSPSVPVESFVVDEANATIGVPIQWGLDYLAAKEWTDYATWSVSEGFPIEVRKMPDPYHENASPGQDVFIRDLIKAGEDRGVFLVKAGTGTGKTPSALYFVGHFAKTALIIVTSKSLASKWRQDVTHFLGLTKEEVGVVEEGKANWLGKKVVIAVVHNLVGRHWDPEFYGYFGIVIWDEIQLFGSLSFSKSLYQFPSRYRFAMSADPSRKDRMDRLFLNYFGEPKVINTNKPLECRVFIHPFSCACPLPIDIDDGVLINWMASHGGRNNFCWQLIASLYQRSRTTLVIGDRIEQLQWLMGVAMSAGIPSAELALYTRSYVDEGKELIFKQEVLDNVRNRVKNKQIRILFATYGMMKQGEDMPPLDAGVDVTPIASGNQVIGRIRRPFIDKQIPEWHTVADSWHVKLVRKTDARIKDYRKAHATIYSYGTQTN